MVVSYELFIKNQMIIYCKKLEIYQKIRHIKTKEKTLMSNKYYEIIVI
jgi:hypothetical protein